MVGDEVNSGGVYLFRLQDSCGATTVRGVLLN